MSIDLGENRDNQTWSGLLVFIVGLQEDKMADLEEESDQNGDLVITEHMDSYNNLTLKTMAAFDWMLTFCPQTEYLLKTDDDMFIQVRFFMYTPTLKSFFFECSYFLRAFGGFQLEFVSKSRVVNQTTCYKFECSQWWKIYLKKILFKICSLV